MVTNKFILETYIERALGLYRSRASFHSGHIICRCNVCGDSEHDKRKRRGYILKRNPKSGEWIYYCHNDDCDANSGMLATNWLKRYFPELYHDFRKENFLSNRTIISSRSEQIIEAPYNEKDDTKFFVPINKSDDELFRKARQYCESRLIPKDIWSKWFVATGGRFQGRMVIPFFDNNGSIYYYQCRTLIDQDPKYLNRKMDDGEKGVYNIHNIDNKKQVMVTEGPIDSMFLDNAIATLGVKFTDKVKLELSKLKCYYIFDNDAAGKSAARKFLDNGYPVFNWSKLLKSKNITIKIKDINDLVMTCGTTKFTFSDLARFFTDNAFDKVWFI